MANELVTLDGYPLTGVTRDGVWKRLGEIEGWWDSPPPRRQRADRTNGDGSFRTPIEYGNRLITYEGRVISKNHDYLHQAAGILTALGHRGKTKFLVQGHGPTQWAMVDPRDSVKTSFETDSYLQFQIPLEAIDPFKYGAANSFSVALGSAVNVFHRGTVPAWPVVTVTGSAPGGYAVSLGGRLIRVTAPLVSGTPHTLDMRTGILRVGGSRVHSAITVAEYWSVKPGARQAANTAPVTTGSGTVKFDFYDTYI